MIAFTGISNGAKFQMYINPTLVRHLFQEKDGVVKIVFAPDHAILVEGVASQIAERFANLLR